MKMIRMIKENDLFSWKVGDILENDKVISVYDGYVATFEAGYLVNKGYAEWVKEDELGRIEEEPEKIEIPPFTMPFEAHASIEANINLLVEAVNKLREDVDKLKK